MENGLLGFAGQGPSVDIDPNTQLFTSSGIWTKPADCQWVRVILVGGGGGGAGGRRNNISRPAGGQGGGGGAIAFLDVPAGLLPSTVSVTIGAGGSAGTGATSANSNGTSGGAGGQSAFGDFLLANGGSGGVAADSATGVTGAIGHLHGGDGGNNFLSSPTQPTRYWGTSGGGAGGGQNEQHTIFYPSSGTTAVTPFLEPQKYGLLGSGGMGGAYNFLGTTTNGSTVGTFGNGGGGGGGGKSANNGQNGSAGGDGYCLVVGYGTAIRPINVQEFRTTGTWTKPTDPRLTTARVFAIGAGGGGGSGRRWDRTKGAYLTGTEFALSNNATGSNYASIADNAVLDITGDIDIQVKVAMTGWGTGPWIPSNSESAAIYTLVGKFTTTGNQKSYQLYISSWGVLHLGWSTTGSDDLSANATDSLTFAENTVKWVRATMDVNNGAGQRVIKFYTSDDGTTWTQLGSTVTASGATSIYSGTAGLTMPTHSAGGSNLLLGYLYRVIIKDGYDGAGNTIVDVNFETATAGATSFTESSANALTVNINTTTTNCFGGGGGCAGRVSYAELPLAWLPTTVDTTVGIGGTGGAGVTTDYRNGNAGADGGNSSFGDFVFALGGGGGFGGNANTGQSTIGSYNTLWGFLTGGSRGGVGGTTAPGTQPTTGYQASYMTSGGGGASGINTSGTTGAGGVSTKSPSYGVALSNTSATQNGTELFPNAMGMFGSTGGGGGSSNGTRDGGNGGRGAGGGGGAGSATGTTSGKGGDGGDGYVLVVCV